MSLLFKSETKGPLTSKQEGIIKNPTICFSYRFRTKNMLIKRRTNNWDFFGEIVFNSEIHFIVMVIVVIFIFIASGQHCRIRQYDSCEVSKANDLWQANHYIAKQICNFRSTVNLIFRL